jgi:hypothetical protein
MKLTKEEKQKLKSELTLYNVEKDIQNEICKYYELDKVNEKTKQTFLDKIEKEYTTSYYNIIESFINVRNNIKED